jgi:hypothetical protein
MAIAIAAQFLPQTKAAEPFKPIPVYSAVSIVAGSQLYIRGGSHYIIGPIKQFIALDLGRSWTSNAPAWKKLKFDGAIPTGGSQGFFGSLGNDFLFFSSNGTNVYNIATDDWSKVDALTLPFDAKFPATVTVKDLIYGMENAPNWNETWRFTEFNTTSKTYTFTEHRGPPVASYVKLVYSPISDTIFAYEDSWSGPNGMWSFSLTSKTWVPVVRRDDAECDRTE